MTKDNKNKEEELARLHQLARSGDRSALIKLFMMIWFK